MTEDKARVYFRIAASSGVPIYRQLIDQVKTLVATGALELGTFLPSVRQVAAELAINPMTVSKAYSLLEKEGVLEFVRGQGMKIRGTAASQEDLSQRQGQMIPLLKEVIVKASQLSLRPAKVMKMLEDLWNKEAKNE